MKKIRTTTGAEFGFSRQWANRTIVIAECENCGAEFPYDSELDMRCYDCEGDGSTPEELAEDEVELQRMKVELAREGKIEGVAWS